MIIFKTIAQKTTNHKKSKAQLLLHKTFKNDTSCSNLILKQLVSLFVSLHAPTKAANLRKVTKE